VVGLASPRLAALELCCPAQENILVPLLHRVEQRQVLQRKLGWRVALLQATQPHRIQVPLLRPAVKACSASRSF
jgi:hypothetical protein